jgi:hypothetical protein
VVPVQQKRLLYAEFEISAMMAPASQAMRRGISAI